ncbi:hypothetical protein BDY19DRAFT_991671 [Irpex rosettiformis]|uniref:Uncharacterized protein n=1 Tax=Irpex rosettiformis TaxID=378272 RepID=A0ACB8U9V9_9APHY|nr:hypothetical protein BDY19DRAFT_991671 [Irpex rosettiformis]
MAVRFWWLDGSAFGRHSTSLAPLSLPFAASLLRKLFRKRCKGGERLGSQRRDELFQGRGWWAEEEIIQAEARGPTHPPPLFIAAAYNIDRQAELHLPLCCGTGGDPSVAYSATRAHPSIMASLDIIARNSTARQNSDVAIVDYVELAVDTGHGHWATHWNPARRERMPARLRQVSNSSRYSFSSKIRRI